MWLVGGSVLGGGGQLSLRGGQKDKLATELTGKNKLNWEDIGRFPIRSIIELGGFFKVLFLASLKLTRPCFK